MLTVGTVPATFFWRAQLSGCHGLNMANVGSFRGLVPGGRCAGSVLGDGPHLREACMVVCACVKDCWFG